MSALLLLAGAAAMLALRLTGGPAPLSAADAPALLAARSDRLLLLRYAPTPSILVALFPTLHAQAEALNRAAIFLETKGGPRDRAPDDASVTRIIAASHQTFDRFYDGHDYRAADLHRLWRLEDLQGLRIAPAEKTLRRSIENAEAEHAGFTAIISLPPPGEPPLDDAGRAAILRHELSHGRYFTEPGYAAAVLRFWKETLSPAERDAFCRFLAANSYDSSNQDLMANETQAYLCNTPDPRFFRPEDVQLTADRQALLCETLN